MLGLPFETLMNQSKSINNKVDAESTLSVPQPCRALRQVPLAHTPEGARERKHQVQYLVPQGKTNQLSPPFKHSPENAGSLKGNKYEQRKEILHHSKRFLSFAPGRFSFHDILVPIQLSTFKALLSCLYAPCFVIGTGYPDVRISVFEARFPFLLCPGVSFLSLL